VVSGRGLYVGQMSPTEGGVSTCDNEEAVPVAP
jgi:hypothetical protein